VDVVSVRSPHGGESPWWLGLQPRGGGSSAVVLRALSSRIDAAMIATNAAALEQAHE